MRFKLGQLLSRRDFMNTAISTSALMALPKMATAGGHSAVNQKIIEAAKSAGTADLKGIIWALYYAPMKASVEKFGAETGTNFKDIKDISIFVAPPAVVAEGVAKSPEFDLFHINSNMIPTLASIGMLEELDPYMEEVGFDYNAVGTFDTFMKYKGATYGMPTDGNVHTQFIHWATVEANSAAYEDKFGKSPSWPGTWEEEIEWMDEVEVLKDKDLAFARLLQFKAFSEIGIALASKIKYNENEIKSFKYYQTKNLFPKPDVEYEINKNKFNEVAIEVFERFKTIEGFKHIDKDLPDLQKAIDDLLQVVDKRLNTSFESILNEVNTEKEAIAFFLALLEAVRWGFVKASQNNDGIKIEKNYEL